MKSSTDYLLRLLILCALFPCARFDVHGQPAIISIKSLDAAGTLEWTNRMLPEQPVYEIFQSRFPEGPWDHLAYVTNANTFPLPVSPVETKGTAFFKVAWVGDSLLEFDYVFDEGYGVTAVAGRISFPILPPNVPAFGFWRLEEVLVVDGFHPIGVGQMQAIRWLANDGLQVWLTGPVDGVFLDGTLQRGTRGGQPAYTSFAGQVFADGFAGPSLIGDFLAVRTP